MSIHFSREAWCFDEVFRCFQPTLEYKFVSLSCTGNIESHSSSLVLPLWWCWPVVYLLLYWINLFDLFFRAEREILVQMC